MFQYSLHSSWHQELPWFVISNTRLQHWRALSTQLVFIFWISDSAWATRLPLLTYYGFGAFQYTEENIFLVNLYSAMSVLLCPALHQGASVCAEVGVLMTQKFLLKTIMFIFPARQTSVPLWNPCFLQDWDLLECKIFDVFYLYRRYNNFSRFFFSKPRLTICFSF